MFLLKFYRNPGILIRVLQEARSGAHFFIQITDGLETAHVDTDDS